MDPLQQISVHAAWMADFSEHFPLGAEDIRRLHVLRDPRERRSVLRHFRMLFDRFHGHRDSPDALGLRPFTPPF